MDMGEPVGAVIPTTRLGVVVAALQREVVEVHVLSKRRGATLAEVPIEHGVGEQQAQGGALQAQGAGGRPTCPPACNSCRRKALQAHKVL